MNISNSTQDNYSLVEYQVNSEGLFVCSDQQCGKIFRYKSEIKRHMIKHSKERPFQCPFPGCTCVFKRKDIMNRHLRSHNPLDQTVLQTKRKTKQSEKPKFRLKNIDIDEEDQQIDDNLRELPRHYLSQSTSPIIHSCSPSRQMLSLPSTTNMEVQNNFKEQQQIINNGNQDQKLLDEAKYQNLSQYLQQQQYELGIQQYFNSYNQVELENNSPQEQNQKYTQQEFQKLLEYFDIDKQFSKYLDQQNKKPSEIKFNKTSYE